MTQSYQQENSTFIIAVIIVFPCLVNNNAVLYVACLTESSVALSYLTRWILLSGSFIGCNCDICAFSHNSGYTALLARQPLPCTLHNAYLTLRTAHFRLHTAHFTLYNAQSTLHTTHCALNTAHFTLKTAYYKLHTEHCKMHSVHYKLNNAY